MKILNFIFFVLSVSSLFGQIVPDKPNDMSNGIYSKYKLNLDTAYLNNDSFEIALQLANLEAEPDLVYKYMCCGIKQNLENCDRIYSFYRLFKDDNFIVNLVKRDTLVFEKYFNLCINHLGKDSYNIYLENRQIQYQKRLSKRTKLDTTKFNRELILKLSTILIDDQRIRGQLSSEIGKESDEYRLLWKEIRKLDSLNLLKVTKIIEDYGFPAKEEVGYDHVYIVLLVLHHQADINVRMRFLPILEKAVIEGNLSQGWLSTYKMRNRDILLSKE